MQPYHYAWLSIHPDRSEEWLKERLKDGFDVHHMDGDRTNNDPSNLCLVEHLDHMRLHNSPLANRLEAGKAARIMNRRRESSYGYESRDQIGAKLYEYRLKPMAWRDAFIELCGKPDDPHFNINATAIRLAKEHARKHGLPWPIDVAPFQASEDTIKHREALRIERAESRERFLRSKEAKRQARLDA